VALSGAARSPAVGEEDPGSGADRVGAPVLAGADVGPGRWVDPAVAGAPDEPVDPDGETIGDKR
jgi:hypothetical protein